MNNPDIKKILRMIFLKLFLIPMLTSSIMIKKTCSLLLIAYLLLTGCNRSPNASNISQIEADLQITRFEQMLFTADPSNLKAYIPLWESEFGDFFRDYCYVLKLGDIHDAGFADRLKLFVTNHFNYRSYQRTMEVYPNLDSLTKELNKAFKYYRYYFPEKPLPRVITFVSGINQSAITDDNLLAIGLDKYLGRDDQLYLEAEIYSYLVKNMHPGKIMSDCMSFWSETEFPFNDSVDNLISNMIYLGRQVYFTRAMLPDEPDSLLWGFSQNDLDFCKTDEGSMWTYLIENKLIFNTDKFTIEKLVHEGPFTKEFGRNSPARATVWIGYRIVCSFMENNPGVSLGELMEESNYLKIMNQSTYNP
jgi:hypothetical protein